MTSSHWGWLFPRKAHRTQGNTYIYQFIKEDDKGPWLVWLSGLSASLRTKGLLV